GRAGVQDEGSQLCALALVAAPVAGRDEHWLDLCAGPGGKAALLAGLAAERGAHLTANELHEHRAELVRAATAHWPVSVVVGDAAAMPAIDGGYDRVLLDAPCTGLGALRRRPEVRWRRQPADLAQLSALQSRLLAAAIRLTRPGGVIAYVVCSPHPAETTAIVAAAADAAAAPVKTVTVETMTVEAPRVEAAPVDAIGGEAAPVEVLDARPAFVGVPHLGAGPFVQLWPHRHGTDAMFTALLRRREADGTPTAPA
nr:hypothetical protein [Actinomycetota bacterium]